MLYCYIWYSEEGLWPRPCPLLAVPNVTAHPPTASVPITVSLCDGPLLCGFNVAIKWLTHIQATDIKQHISAVAGAKLTVAFVHPICRIVESETWTEIIDGAVNAGPENGKP